MLSDDTTNGSNANHSESEKKIKNDKFENFEFNKIVKKKKPVVKQKPEETSKTRSKAKNKKKKVTYNPFKYGRDQFEDLNQLSRFLLREYHNIEKHASNLLNNEEFITWLRTQSKNEQQFTEWVEKIL